MVNLTAKHADDAKETGGPPPVRAENLRNRRELYRLRAENARLRQQVEVLRAENHELGREMRRLRATLDTYLARAQSTRLFGPLEMTAGTAVGPRRHEHLPTQT